MSEEIGAAPLPVLNVGMACQYQNWNNEKAHAECSAEGLKEYIDDALDLIEFANGPADSEWGKVRAEMGHPEPFNMKYLAIGNEQWDKFYFDRLKFFVDAIRKAHPEILIIGSSGPDSEGKMFDLGWEDMKKRNPSDCMFEVQDRGNGKVVLKAVNGTGYMAVAGLGMSGDLRLSSVETEDCLFMWQDMLHGQCMLMSLKTHRYVGLDPASGEAYAADWPGTSASRMNGTVFLWKEVKSNGK